MQEEVTLMSRITYIGMDVHSTSFSFCALEQCTSGQDQAFAHVTAKPDYKEVVKYINSLKAQRGKDSRFICAYEAGCLGYSLYHQLSQCGIDCVILAPSTILSPVGKRIKTDKRDAENIARSLAHGLGSHVFVPTVEDEEVREYLRMRNDHKNALKVVKQQINSFCLRHGHAYDGTKTKWTVSHLTWLRRLALSPMLREALDEYLAAYEQLTARLNAMEARIEELAAQKRYAGDVKKLCCFLGIKTACALSLIVETGDFRRFAKGELYSAYLGLTPSEHSSGEKICRGRISKAGNTNLRRMLTESAQGICKGQIGHKSKALLARQEGNERDIIIYADRANDRLRRKYYRLIRSGKKKNVAVTAVARELACFIWGMMTNNLELRGERQRQVLAS